MPDHDTNHDSRETELDPDWAVFRALGHRMIDDMVDALSTVETRPVWQPVPQDVRQRLATPLPRAAGGATQTYEAFLRDVFPYSRGNSHPRYWGWVNGSGLPCGMLADLLASTMNSSVGAFNTSVTLVEEQVLEWLKEMFDWPADGTGLLTSGCSMANIVALAVARHSGLGASVRTHGVGAQDAVLYASTEVHCSVVKAVELLGLGSTSLRLIPTDADFRIDLAELRRRLAEDRAANLRPIAIIANAGTVATGAIDPIDDLADLCRSEELWLHVDGAFGALAALCPTARDLVAGLQRADSLAFDLHKWMYLPFDVGCVLVRDGALHLEAFAAKASYMSRLPDGPAAHPVSFADRGIELSRRFRALKVWFALKPHGVDAFARAIGRNIEQAHTLARQIRQHEELELCAPSR